MKKFGAAVVGAVPWAVAGVAVVGVVHHAISGDLEEWATDWTGWLIAVSIAVAAYLTWQRLFGKRNDNGAHA